jgi:hypothetical protein
MKIKQPAWMQHSMPQRQLISIKTRSRVPPKLIGPVIQSAMVAAKSDGLGLGNSRESHEGYDTGGRSHP